MEKQKILEIENQAKLKNISAAKYWWVIGINSQSYYQAKALLKIKDKNKIYKVQNEEPVIENKSLPITINDFSIRLEESKYKRMKDENNLNSIKVKKLEWLLDGLEMNLKNYHKEAKKEVLF